VAHQAAREEVGTPKVAHLRLATVQLA